MLGYRMFAHVNDDRAFIIRRGIEQLHSWLKEKGYPADALEPGRQVSLGPKASSLLLERRNPDGSHSIRARLIEQSGNGQWTSELTIHVPGRTDRHPWLLLDIDAPAYDRNDHMRSGQRRWTGVPKIAKHLLEVFSATDGTARMRPDVIRTYAGEAEELLHAVCDPERRGLVFVACCDSESPFETFANRISRLMRHTTGLAVTYVLDPAAIAHFNDGIGATHQVLPGRMRTFGPDVDPALAADALRHRLLDTRRIEPDGEPAIARLLGRRARDAAAGTPLRKDVVRVARLFDRDTDELAISGSLVAPTAIDTPAPRIGITTDGVVDHRADLVVPSSDLADVHTALAVLCQEMGFTDITLDAIVHLELLVREAGAMRQKASNAADANILRSVVAELRETIDELADSNDQLRSERDWAQLEQAIADDERRLAEARVRDLRVKLESAGRAVEAWAPAAIETLVTRVQDYDELVSRIDELTHVEYTGKRDSIEDLERSDPLANWATKAWEAALALEDYANAVLVEGGIGGVENYLRNTPAGRHGYSGNRHANGESKDVQNNEKLRLLRVFPVPVDVDPAGQAAMYAHFKLAQQGMMSPRLHYLDDTANTKKIYIGYIGRHLRTKQTN